MELIHVPYWISGPSFHPPAEKEATCKAAFDTVWPGEDATRRAAVLAGPALPGGAGTLRIVLRHLKVPSVFETYNHLRFM